MPNEYYGEVLGLIYVLCETSERHVSNFYWRTYFKAHNEVTTQGYIQKTLKVVPKTPKRLTGFKRWRTKLFMRFCEKFLMR